MVLVVIGACMGGGGCTDVGNFLYCGGACGASIRVGDVVHDPTHREESGRVPPSGGTETDEADSTA